MADFFVGNNDKIDFQDLMGHRVHEILLVASPYDAFILEEDGHLTEQILTEYIGMNFNYAPRVTRVRTGYQAMQIIKKKKFDLVVMGRRGTTKITGPSLGSVSNALVQSSKVPVLVVN